MSDEGKILAADILSFLAQYAGKSMAEPEEWSSPDAALLEAFALRIREGHSPCRVFSRWGSGGYHPYISKEGRKAHDSLVQRIEQFSKNSK